MNLEKLTVHQLRALARSWVLPVGRHDRREDLLKTLRRNNVTEKGPCMKETTTNLNAWRPDATPEEKAAISTEKQDKILSHEELVSVRDALKQAQAELNPLIMRLKSGYRSSAMATMRNIQGALEILESKR